MAFFRYTQELEDTVNAWNGITAAPSSENRKRPEGIQVLRNGFVESYFAKAHPLSPGVWFLPLIAWGLYHGYMHAGAGRTIGLLLAGVLLWTLLEYVLHRYVFHSAAGTTFETKLKAFLVHGYHHEFPNDKWRLVAPPLMSWSLGAAVGAIYYVLFGVDHAWPLFSGTAVGYLAYDWIHYYTHHFRPRGGVGAYLRRYHLEHHFKDATTHYGITSPLWDFVFGTHTNKSDADRRRPRDQRAA